MVIFSFVGPSSASGGAAWPNIQAESRSGARGCSVRAHPHSLSFLYCERYARCVSGAATVRPASNLVEVFYGDSPSAISRRRKRGELHLLHLGDAPYCRNVSIVDTLHDAHGFINVESWPGSFHCPYSSRSRRFFALGGIFNLMASCVQRLRPHAPCLTSLDKATASTRLCAAHQLVSPQACAEHNVERFTELTHAVRRGSHHRGANVCFGDCSHKLGRSK
jgi:hypothetical protein